MKKGISCHIGLNRVDPIHYSGWSGPLTACEFDAEDMQSIADRIGYDTNILLTQAATRDAVTTAIEQAAGNLSEGDIFFLTYSGHGGQVPDANGDERDLSDETWCLYDGELIDDELRHLWTKFDGGVRILLLSDSCHSGTVARMRAMAMELPEPYIAALEGRSADESQFRMMPIRNARQTYLDNKVFYDQIQNDLPPVQEQSPIDASIRLISGCQDNQLSLDGVFNGLFTGTLKRVYADGAFQDSYDAFHRGIVRLMPPTQTPNHFVIGKPNPEFDAQRPFEI